MAVQLKDILIMCVVVSMTGIAIASFTQEQAINHGVVDIDTSFNDTFNLLPEMTNVTEQIRDNILEGTIISVEGFQALFNGGLAIMKLVLNSVTLPLRIFTNIITALGLPEWLSIGITSILIIVIAFVIINAVFGRGKA